MTPFNDENLSQLMSKIKSRITEEGEKWPVHAGTAKESVIFALKEKSSNTNQTKRSNEV